MPFVFAEEVRATPRRRRTQPFNNPDDLGDHLRLVVNTVIKQYRELWNESYERPVGGLTQRITGGDVSDPTLTTAARREGLRGDLRRAADSIREAIDDLEGAEKVLVAAKRIVDPRPEPLKDMGGGARGIDVDEQKEAEQAKARRQRRGED